MFLINASFSMFKGCMVLTYVAGIKMNITYKIRYSLVLTGASAWTAIDSESADRTDQR